MEANERMKCRGETMFLRELLAENSLFQESSKQAKD